MVCYRDKKIGVFVRFSCAASVVDACAHGLYAKASLHVTKRRQLCGDIAK
jgi:hypothetical protein